MKSVRFHFFIGGSLRPMLDLDAVCSDDESCAVLAMLAVDKSAFAFEGGYRSIERSDAWFSDGLPCFRYGEVEDLHAIGLCQIVRCLMFRVELHDPFYAQRFEMLPTGSRWLAAAPDTSFDLREVWNALRSSH